jgi:hypothetical protein
LLCVQVNYETQFFDNGLTLLFLVLADGDQILAAEPGFHRDPPRGGGLEVRAVRRIPDHRSERGGQQSENGMALGF